MRRKWMLGIDLFDAINENNLYDLSSFENLFLNRAELQENLPVQVLFIGYTVTAQTSNSSGM